MRHGIYIEGFQERIEEAVAQSGLSKCEIARRGKFDRKTFCGCDRTMLQSGILARFCAVTGVSADWMLGLLKRKELK